MEELTAKVPIEIPWSEMRNRPLSLQEKQTLREFYDGSYPVRNNYQARHPFNGMISAYRYAITEAVFPDLGRVLDAGCAAGAEVLEFRRQGIEAFGFDLCPDLHDIAYPEVCEHLRIGRLDHIPFSKEDRLKTVVSFDVIEHVPIDCLQEFPRELRRLGISQIGCIISKDTGSEGHITIQDTDFYVDLFVRAGYRLIDEITEILDEVMAPVGWNHATQQPVVERYNLCGNPKNSWNCVPGHLFFGLRA